MNLLATTERRVWSLLFYYENFGNEQSDSRQRLVETDVQKKLMS